MNERVRPETELEQRVRQILRAMFDELPRQIGPDPVLVARARRSALTTAVVAFLATALILGSAVAVAIHVGGTHPATPAARPGVTPCHVVVPKCHVRRLLNMVLRHGNRRGALRSVDGFDLHGIISFDDALRRAVQEDGIHNDAGTVQVILGSADADRLHWGHGTRLYYAVDWTNVCVPIHGGGSPSPRQTPPSATPSCVITNWGTVIDARTGAFIVSGTA